jgi:hypothetical protein
MVEARRCDICGGLEGEMIAGILDQTRKLEVDRDGLWICMDCKKRIRTDPVMGPCEVNPDRRLDVLVGKTAGAVCRDSTLPYSPPYSQVIDAASHIAYDNDMFMSAWVFAAQWQDGSTVWRSPDNAFTAIVSAENEVRINPTMPGGWR